MQETLQEFYEKTHCDGRLPQYKTRSRSVTLNNQMPVFVNICTVKYALLKRFGLSCDNALLTIFFKLRFFLVKSRGYFLNFKRLILEFW